MAEADFNVIVIGAGAGGPVVAKELAAQGLDVLVLEGGSRFLDPESEWNHLENDAQNPTDGFFRVGPADRQTSAWIRETPQNSFIFQVSGVGGTTLHYFGNHPRAAAGVFRGYDRADANAYDRAHQFPFSYEELIPYFERTEAILPVAPAAMGTKEKVWLEGASKVIGRDGQPLAFEPTNDITRDSYRAQPNAILQPEGKAARGNARDDPSFATFPEARGCTFCGYCFQGCYEPRNAPRNLIAKRSTDNSYVPMMLTADAWGPMGAKPAELRADAFVTKIETGEGGDRGRTATGVTYRDTNSGEMTTVTGDVVVMAGGPTENPRLWLNSGLPNSNDWVGRGATDHFFDYVTGVFPDRIPTNSSLGTGSSARADFPGRGGLENVGLPPALQAFSAQFSDAGMQGFYTNGLNDRAGADHVGRPVGKDLLRVMENIDRVLSVLVITDDDVEFQNQVSTSTMLPPDEHGPIPKLVFNGRRRSARTAANRAFLNRKAVELLRAAGAEEVYRVAFPPLFLHGMTTMRMGESARDSVVDEHGEAREVSGLFIADSSSLANALGGPNPVATVQAIATRTAEFIFQDRFEGDPFVAGDNSPVSSIDDKVTQAVIDRGL